MPWDASSVMFPGFNGSFGSQSIIHPRPDDPARVDQAPTCVPAALVHGSPFFIRSYQEALSAASVAALMIVFFIGPLMPSQV